jgi:cytochrome c peroxidase
VVVTGPYFHDGSALSLPKAVDIMGRAQLGRDLPSQDVDLIVKFLGTLTGEYQGRSLSTEIDQSTR